jgi:type II secretory pathway component PulF
LRSYRFEAARADGAIVRGAVDARSAAQAAGLVVERGLLPIAVAEAEPERRRAAGRRDLAVVFRSVAALVACGVPLERALASSEALCRGTLREVIAGARRALREGGTLAGALAAGRGTVPRVVVGMVRAGERGSALAGALERVATHLEQEADLVGRVRQALAYPLVLLVAGTVAVLVIGTVVIPRFAELLGDLGQTLPAATRVLLAASSLLTHQWWAVVLVIGATVAAGAAWLRRPAGRRRVHDALLAMPVVGPVRHALATTRVARALGGMLGAGMPLLPALDAAREAAGDEAVAARLRSARERVAGGMPLTTALERERALTPAALQLVGVGESSARLGEMSRRAGDLAAQEAERGLKTLVTLIEPVLIVGFGAVVAFVAVALLQAVYAVRP